MKKILLLAILIFFLFKACSAQDSLLMSVYKTDILRENKFFHKGDVISYSLAVVAGGLEGFNQGLYHYPRKSDFFNPYNDGWELDADHISKFLILSTWSVNVGFSMNDFQGNKFWPIAKRVGMIIILHQIAFTVIHNSY